jgi:hypothetical protein
MEGALSTVRSTTKEGSRSLKTSAKELPLKNYYVCTIKELLLKNYRN